jgi:hypothetical protein
MPVKLRDHLELKANAERHRLDCGPAIVAVGSDF